ncbi:MAG TPA: GntR family transcriptional regulator, partial [Candidatus Synoicihabitans sp.]|nr:GntR family transcriptional regulator [Candidatus Synoicihabitans sp.]
MKPNAFEKELLRLAATNPPHAPLPPTRTLGKKLDVSFTTVSRALQRLATEGKLWQHPNGRFFPAAAKSVLDRPKPVACLTRRLELCSELYRELLEGISAGCGADRRTMLLWHDELLVNHHDPHEPPVFATVQQQRAILGDFIQRHGAAAGGFLLDHVWSDEVLGEHAAELRPGVLLLRRTAVPGLSNLHADFAGGALQALGHLLGRGYELVVPVEPFHGDPSIADFLTTVEAASRSLGCAERLAPRANAATERSRKSLIGNLRDTRRRVALLCPEDNVARLLLLGLRDAGIDCPKQVGLLS